MKSKDLAEFYKAFIESELEELDQTITHYEEMLRIYKEKRRVIENTITVIDNDK